MKRTTLTLEDTIFAAIRRRAEKQSRTLRDVVNDLLREALHPPKPGPYRLDWTGFKGQGVQPGVNLEDRDALWDLMEGRRS